MNRFFSLIKMLLPKSHMFSLSIDNTLRRLFASLTALPADFREYVDKIFLDVFPHTTRSLNAWIDQFGLRATNHKESSNRVLLATEWQAQGSQGADSLQRILNNAGFDVIVHRNEPAIDPATLLAVEPIMVAGNAKSIAGSAQSFAGRTGGELLVNGYIATNIATYISHAGNSSMVCGNKRATAGRFDTVKKRDKIYTLPVDASSWWQCFFVGGNAIRDPETHKIVSIEQATIPAERKEEFRSILLRYKPAQTWAGLFLNYT